MDVGRILKRDQIGSDRSRFPLQLIWFICSCTTKRDISSPNDNNKWPK